MATFRLRRFSNPAVLKAVEPERFLQFIEPHRDFFALRGMTLPPAGHAVDLDYESVVNIFLSPDTNTPGALVDALYFVDEMSSADEMDTLLQAADEAGLTLDDGDDHSPADVAIQVWLLDSDLLERKHAEQQLYKPRSFEYFQTGKPEVPPFSLPTDAVRLALEQTLDEWFVKKKRGAGSRVFVYPKDDDIWFLVRHGEPYTRAESMDGAEASSVCYRPLKYDVLVYQPDVGELRINARSKGEKQLYRTEFGRFLFGDANFFPGEGKYTLEPLREYGEASLNCVDVDGIEWIKLTEIQYFWGGGFSEVETRKADDFLAALHARGGAIPESVRIIRAVFRVKFEGAKADRSVTIRPSNIAQFTRDDDAAHVEDWLMKRGFIVGEAAGQHAVHSTLLVGH